jgi:thiopurine S-methyltransferase
MQAEFWHDRWRTGQIGFHQAVIDRNLREGWPALSVPKDQRVFVPLCGKSLDLLWLCDQGHSVTGVELSTIALESFCMEHGVPARRRILDDFDVYAAPKLRLFRGDFFALTPELLGPMAAIYDRAALISWIPELRAAYVKQITELSNPGTKTLLVTMEYPQEQMKGPPFSISADEVGRLYAGHHEIRTLSRHDILANEPRLRSRGITQLHELCYLLTRL